MAFSSRVEGVIQSLHRDTLFCPIKWGSSFDPKTTTTLLRWQAKFPQVHCVVRPCNPTICIFAFCVCVCVACCAGLSSKLAQAKSSSSAPNLKSRARLPKRPLVDGLERFQWYLFRRLVLRFIVAEMGDSAAQLRNTPIASLLDVHARGGGGLTQPWAGVCVCVCVCVW